jgi:periplasmic protein TonB
MDDIAMSDLETEPRPSRAIWIFAAIGALALHLGGAALAVAHLQPNDGESELGVEAIEIGLEMTSPHLEATDHPPGPDQEALAPSPPIPEQKADVKPTELPKDLPTETENPDRVVALNNAQESKEDDPKIAQVQTEASEESVAQEAMATPSVENVPEGRSQAPVQGIGKSLERLRASWEAKMGAHFERNKRALTVPKLKNVKVLLKVKFDRLGHIVSSSIGVSSGDPACDEAALAMLRRSDPIPKPPPLIADEVEGMTFNLPVIFGKARG